ncbi:MAG: LptF/LptG family permease [Elusimicrobia bacterium]|nr:LptF/LptG family permease [Elusimicrobiota bacterium]MBD3412072.1 LptF/LptG family permease [Elusimicrobiota bacterium]
MRILKKYFFVEFIKPCLFGLASFVIIIAVSHLFEKLDTFTSSGARAYDVFKYILYQLPFMSVQVIPVALLLGALFSFNRLLSTGEITAVKSSGIPMRQIIIPFMIFGVVVSCAVIFINESLIPVFNTRAQYIYRVHIRKLPPGNPALWSNIVLSGKGNIRITAEQLNLAQGKIERVVVDQYHGSVLTQQIDARSAVWNGDAWEFRRGSIRWFSRNGDTIIKEEPFDSRVIDINNTPRDLSPSKIEPEEVNYKTLKDYIRHLEKLGIPNADERVQLHLKIAFPFSNLIVLMIGIPFALRARQGSGKLMSFATALAIAFSYWGFISIGQSLSSARILPPIAGAWFANIIFLGIGIHFLRKIQS